MADGAECLIGPDHIGDGDRASIRKARLGAEDEFHPCMIGGHFDRFGQKPVKREGFVPRPAQKRFVGQKPQLPRNRACADMGIEAVEAAGFAGHDTPACGRVGIGIGQMGEIRPEGWLTIHCDPMHRLRHTCPG